MGARTGDKVAVLDLNNGDTGYGVLTLALTADQIEALNNGGALSFYMAMVGETVGKITYTMMINGKTGFTIDGDSNTTLTGGNGEVSLLQYRRNYAKVTVDAETAAQIAKDGYLQISTNGKSKGSADYNYVMFVDDIVVEEKEA
jgi:hypothetical protein